MVAGWKARCVRAESRNRRCAGFSSCSAEHAVVDLDCRCNDGGSALALGFSCNAARIPSEYRGRDESSLGGERPNRFSLGDGWLAASVLDRRERGATYASNPRRRNGGYITFHPAGKRP